MIELVRRVRKAWMACAEAGRVARAVFSDQDHSSALYQMSDGRWVLGASNALAAERCIEVGDRVLVLGPGLRSGVWSVVQKINPASLELEIVYDDGQMISVACAPTSVIAINHRRDRRIEIAMRT